MTNTINHISSKFLLLSIITILTILSLIFSHTPANSSMNNISYYKPEKLEFIVDPSTVTCFQDIKKSFKIWNIKQAYKIKNQCNNKSISVYFWWYVLRHKINTSGLNLEEINHDLINNLTLLPRYKQVETQIRQILFKNYGWFKISQYYNDNNIPSNLLLAKHFLQLRQEEMMRPEIYNNLVNKIFITLKFQSTSQIEDFINDYGQYLTNDNVAKKIEQFLFNNKVIYAKTIIALLENQKYYNNLLHHYTILQNKKNLNVIRYWKHLPEHIRNTEIILYTSVQHLENNNQDSKILPLLQLVPKNSLFHKYWWSSKQRQARYLISNSKYYLAYILVNPDNLDNISQRHKQEAYWLSGWIALEFLDNPKLAYNFFLKANNKATSIKNNTYSKYWLAQASKRLNKNATYKFWLRQASNNIANFYGQIANFDLNQKMKYDDIIYQKISNRELRSWSDNNILTNLTLLHTFLYDNKDSIDFIVNTVKQYDKNQYTKSDLQKYMYATKDINNFELSFFISRVLLEKNIISPNNQFFFLSEVQDSETSNLIMSIIRQESNFKTHAISRSGARGIMQLTLPTAKYIADMHNKPFSKKDLLTNPIYNIELGSKYVEYLLKKFNNSYVLTIAAYNAGPTTVNQWIKRHGDPRTMSMSEIINWIEKIPYQETRNYVKRVLETTIVYSHIDISETYNTQTKSILKINNIGI